MLTFHHLSLLGAGASGHLLSNAGGTAQGDATPLPLVIKALPWKTQIQVFDLWWRIRLSLRHEDAAEGADFMSGRCSLMCKSFFAYVEALLRREKANVFLENGEMTQSACRVYICWKIQLPSTNQIAASRKGKSEKYCTMRTKQAVPLATATKAKG